MNSANLEKEERKQAIPLQYYYLVPLVILFVTAFLVVVFQVITFFKLRNICCLYITRPCCKIILWLWGITYTVHYQGAQPNKQKIILINHTSNIDAVLLPAICLNNARYFMSKRTYKYIPITIINIFIGTFLIDQQDKPDKRTECFKRAEATLRRTGESVILSPEGTIIVSGKIEKNILNTESSLLLFRRSPLKLKPGPLLRKVTRSNYGKLSILYGPFICCIRNNYI